MASEVDINDLTKTLFECLTSSNPNFHPDTYLEAFTSLPSIANQITFIHKDVTRFFHIFVKFTNHCKDDFVALAFEETATEDLDNGDYLTALQGYSKCIATAESGDLLALAYGNRAVCFLKLKLPKKCLEDTERALAHDSTDELKEEILEIRKDAERSSFQQRSYYEAIPDLASFQENPTIQSANNCVKIKLNQEYGRHVVATRDIRVGEIISIESPYCCVLSGDKFNHCYFCLELCYNTIPCDHCTVALFCSDFCKVKAYATYHKYECPVAASLCDLAKNNSLLLALKITLLVLDDYYRAYTTGYDSSDCYHSDRYKEVKLLKNSLPRASQLDQLHKAIQTAIVFELFSRQTNYFNSFGDDARKKFKELMFLHLQITSFNAVKIYEYTHNSNCSETINFGLGVYSFFSLFGHSCCANVMKTFHGSTMVLRAINNIKRGEQCFVNRYGIRYEAFARSVRLQLFENYALPECRCKACLENWKPVLGNTEEICRSLGINSMSLCDIMRNFIGIDINIAHYLLPRLMEEYKKCEKKEPEGNALTLKKLIVHCYVIFGNKKML